jgi:hypothetical protein
MLSSRHVDGSGEKIFYFAGSAELSGLFSHHSLGFDPAGMQTLRK